MQLRVEAMLAGENGYADMPDISNEDGQLIEALSYWHVSGKRGEAGKISDVTPDDDNVIAESLAGITALLEEFNDRDKGYPSELLENEANPYSDYKHLARVKEWVKDIDGGGYE